MRTQLREVASEAVRINTRARKQRAVQHYILHMTASALCENTCMLNNLSYDLSKRRDMPCVKQSANLSYDLSKRRDMPCVKQSANFCCIELRRQFNIYPWTKRNARGSETKPPTGRFPKTFPRFGGPMLHSLAASTHSYIPIQPRES